MSGKASASSTRFFPPGPEVPNQQRRTLGIRHSDGLSTRRPVTFNPAVVDGGVNYYRPLELNHPRNQYWRRSIGTYLAEQALGQRGADCIIADFPSGYQLYDHLKGPADGPRVDSYLYGSRYVTRFRSTKEFMPHALWLFMGAEMNVDGSRKCDCTYCGHKPQREINAQLVGQMPQGILSQAKEKTRPAAQSSPAGPSMSTGKSHRGPRSAPNALPSGSLPSVSSPSVSLPSFGSLLSKFSHLAMTNLPPTLKKVVEPERHRDLENLQGRRFREGEVVWAKLEVPIQGPAPWQRIELWPGLVRAINVTPKINNDGTRTTAVTCHIMYFAANQTVVIEDCNIGPCLAYALPPPFYQWLMCQPLPDEFKRDLNRLDRFEPNPRSPTVPTLPGSDVLPTFENAWPSYVLALNILGDMFQRWSISGESYEPDGQWYLQHAVTPVLEDSCVHLFTPSSPQVTLFQGMFLRAERVWQNDLVRLNVPLGDARGITKPTTPGSGRMGLFYEICWIAKVDTGPTESEIKTLGRLYELVLASTPDEDNEDDNDNDDDGITNLTGRLLLSQTPVRVKNSKLTYEYPLPEAPRHFKFRCLHRFGSNLVAVEPIAIAGRYYAHLQAEDPPLHRLINSPQNGVPRLAIQSLKGSESGARFANMPLGYMSRDRADAFLQAEIAAKQRLAGRWGVDTNNFTYRFRITDWRGR